MLNVQEALNNFGKGVVKQSRSSLTRQRKNVDKTLWNSLAFNLDVGKNSFRIEFEMEDYGAFQDEGVKGANPSKVSPNAKIKGQQAPNSRFKFGTGSASGTWEQYVNKLEKWVKKRGLRFRDSQGKFAKGGARSMAYVVASNIYNRGIKPSRFFTRSFETQFDKLPEQLVEAFNLDLDDFIKFTRQ